MSSRKDEEEVVEAYLMQHYLMFSLKVETKNINIFNIINFFVVST